MDLELAFTKRSENAAVKHLLTQLKEFKSLFASCGLQFSDSLFDTAQLERKQGDPETLARLWQMQTEVYQQVSDIVYRKNQDVKKCEATLQRILGWSDIDAIRNDVASDMTHAQCKAAVCLMLPLLKKTRTAMKFTEGFIAITERRLFFNADGAKRYDELIAQLLERNEALENRVNELESEAAQASKKLSKLASYASKLCAGSAPVDDPQKSLKRSIDTMKKKLEAAEAALKQQSSENLEKEREDAIQLHKKALHDVDCLRKDRQRDREEIERLNEQLKRVRVHKEFDGDAKNRKNKQK